MNTRDRIKELEEEIARLKDAETEPCFVIVAGKKQKIVGRGSIGKGLLVYDKKEKNSFWIPSIPVIEVSER